MDKDYIIALENLDNSLKRLERVHDSVCDLQIEMRGQSMSFYYRLSLLSGGVLSLSITYIGYLASTSHSQLLFAELLFLGWACLLINIFSSIYRNHFNLDMGHYQTLNTLNDARLEQFKTALIVLEKYPQQFLNLKNEEDIQKQIKTTKNNISVLESAIEKNNKKEKQESLLWAISQRTAHISFFLGMVFITLFAAMNLPIPPKFTILETLQK